MRQLATCRWIEEHQQVLVTGATGTDKSFIACALATTLAAAATAPTTGALHGSSTTSSSPAPTAATAVLGKLARMDVLVLDDWGLAPVQDQERRDLLEILEDRCDERVNWLKTTVILATDRAAEEPAGTHF